MRPDPSLAVEAVGGGVGSHIGERRRGLRRPEKKEVQRVKGIADVELPVIIGIARVFTR